MTAIEPGKFSDPETIQATICAGLDYIGEFVLRAEFQSLLNELYARPHGGRLAFVRDVILDDEQRAVRGIVTPDDLIIQRSTFADGRPTLFCVSKILPLAYPWHRVTMTFDSGADVIQTT